MKRIGINPIVELNAGNLVGGAVGHLKDPNSKCLMKPCIKALGEDLLPYVSR